MWMREKYCSSSAQIRQMLWWSRIRNKKETSVARQASFIWLHFWIPSCKTQFSIFCYCNGTRLKFASCRNVLCEKAVTHANTRQQAICGVRQPSWLQDLTIQDCLRKWRLLPQFPVASGTWHALAKGHLNSSWPVFFILQIWGKRWLHAIFEINKHVEHHSVPEQIGGAIKTLWSCAGIWPQNCGTSRNSEHSRGICRILQIIHDCTTA